MMPKSPFPGGPPPAKPGRGAPGRAPVRPVPNGFPGGSGAFRGSSGRNMSMGDGGSVPPAGVKGNWHWRMTVTILLLCAVAVSVVAAMVPEGTLSSWMVGLALALPTAAVLLGAFVTEKATDAMTPRFSRWGQFFVALGGVLLAFLIGFAGNGVYLSRFVSTTYIPAATPTPVVTAAPVLPENIVFLLDKSGSMYGESDAESQKAIKEMMDRLPDSARVGLVAFDHTILATVPIAELDMPQRRELEEAISIPVEGGTFFDVALEKAMEMYEQYIRSASASLPVAEFADKLIMITDTDGGITKEQYEAYNADFFLKYGVQLNVVRIGEYSGLYTVYLEALIKDSCGRLVDVSDASQLVSVITQFSELTQTTPEPERIIVEEETSAHNMLRNRNEVSAQYQRIRQDWLVGYGTTPNIFYIVMLLNGLNVGLCLMIMLSVQGQFRVQAALSPLLALAAAVAHGYFASTQSWSMGLCLLSFGLVFMRRNDCIR